MGKLSGAPVSSLAPWLDEITKTIIKALASWPEETGDTALTKIKPRTSELAVDIAPCGAGLGLFF